MKKFCCLILSVFVLITVLGGCQTNIEKQNINTKSDNKIFKTLEYNINNFKTKNISIDQTYPQPHPLQLRNINTIDNKTFIFDENINDSGSSLVYCYNNSDLNNYETIEIPGSNMLKQSGNLIISASNKEVNCFNKNLDKIKSSKIPTTSYIYSKNFLNPLFTHIINDKYLCWNEYNLELTVLDIDTGKEKIIQDEIDNFDRKFTYRQVYPTQVKNQVFLVGENKENDNPSVGTVIYAIADLKTGKILEYIDRKELVESGTYINPWTCTIYKKAIKSSLLDTPTNQIDSHILNNNILGYDNKIYDFRNCMIYSLDDDMSLLSSSYGDINSYLLLELNGKTTICVLDKNKEVLPK